jgi:predicted dehydrogenase
MRRRFFLAAGTAAAATAWGRTSQDSIRIAVAGVHGRGRDHVAGFHHVPGCQVVALCDPDENVLRDRSRTFESKLGRPLIQESDIRRLLERRDIDAVSIATPNHWHALAAIWACQAGKDVYVEKPGCHNVFEGRKLIEAAARYNRVVQHGVQLRSSAALREAVELLRNGVIGEVTKARALVWRGRHSIGHLPDTPVPAGLDFDLWQGPAPARPFNANLVHYNWHWRWAYGNGEIGNQGIHELDMCVWGLGESELPVEAAANGRRIWDDDRETPDVLSAQFRFRSGRQMEVEVRPWKHDTEYGTPVGNVFFGSKGILLVRGYQEYKVLLGKEQSPGPRRKAGGDHFGNFIDAVRNRDRSRLHAPVETAHLSSGVAHLGNIAYRLNRRLQFDPDTERFVSDTEADTYLRREYRKPFEVPEKV